VRKIEVKEDEWEGEGTAQQVMTHEPVVKGFWHKTCP